MNKAVLLAFRSALITINSLHNDDTCIHRNSNECAVHGIISHIYNVIFHNGLTHSVMTTYSNCE